MVMKTNSMNSFRKNNSEVGMMQHFQGLKVSDKKLRISWKFANSTSDTPKPEKLEDGTKLYRFIGERNKPDSSFWITEKDFPKTEAEWRGASAVKKSWNGDGAYVEYEIPKGGLNVWRGTAAKQESDISGYVLNGGKEQIWVPPGEISPSLPKPSPWNSNF